LNERVIADSNRVCLQVASNDTDLQILGQLERLLWDNGIFKRDCKGTSIVDCVTCFSDLADELCGESDICLEIEEVILCHERPCYHDDTRGDSKGKCCKRGRVACRHQHTVSYNLNNLIDLETASRRQLICIGGSESQSSVVKAERRV